jgi:hypothetical protein
MTRLLAGALASAVLLIAWLSRRRAKRPADGDRSGVRTSATGQVDAAKPALAPRYNDAPFAEVDGPVSKTPYEDSAPDSQPSDSDQVEPQLKIPNQEDDGRSLLSKNVDGYDAAANHIINPSGQRSPVSKDNPIFGRPAIADVEPSAIGTHVPQSAIVESEFPDTPVAVAVVMPTSVNEVQTEDLGSNTTIGQVTIPILNGAQSEDRAAAVKAPSFEQTGDNSESEEREETPGRYRSPTRTSPRQAPAHSSNQEVTRRTPTEVLLGIRIRLTFDRFDFCTIGLLPEHTSQLDDEVRVTLRGNDFLLVSQEDWYQDLFLDGIGDSLRQGVELRGVLADRRRVRWLLSGRDIYVLASHPRASGFVSTSRLALGRSHVVLYRAELLQQIEAVLAQAGCDGYARLDESHGIPSDWCGLRDVSPTKALPLDSGDPFYSIKPAPDIEIDFKSGICLRNSVWLAGYPPIITILGKSTDRLKVIIDGKEAQYLTDGSLVSEGYDLPGLHSVYCDGLSCSRSYSIEEAPETWEKWPAYNFCNAAICGPLVELASAASERRIITVPMSNPILLGAEPGQIFRCSPRSVARWKGFVPFEVVWALPAQSLTCDKKTSRILQFAKAAVIPKVCHQKIPNSWCTAILDASRKGLRIESEAPDSSACWREYKRAAKKILRGRR